MMNERHRHHRPLPVKAEEKLAKMIPVVFFSIPTFYIKNTQPLFCKTTSQCTSLLLFWWFKLTPSILVVCTTSRVVFVFWVPLVWGWLAAPRRSTWRRAMGPPGVRPTTRRESWPRSIPPWSRPRRGVGCWFFVFWLFVCLFVVFWLFVFLVVGGLSVRYVWLVVGGLLALCWLVAGF